MYANGKLAIRYLFQYIFSRLRVEPSTDNRSKYSLFLILPRSLANAQVGQRVYFTLLYSTLH